MDLNAIGNFIATKREEKELSQTTLAEQLGVTEKVVAKWEAGKSFPASKYVVSLCEILGITANELMAGKELSNEDYREVADANAFSYANYRNKNRVSMIFSLVTIVCALLASVMVIFVCGFGKISTGLKVVAIIISVLVILISLVSLWFIFAEQSYESYYVCPECKSHFTPDVKSEMSAKSNLCSKELECPNCGKTNFCKHSYRIFVSKKNEVSEDIEDDEVEETEDDDEE